ncbi:hypothetical protein CPB86DRAFT_593431 [Serendipita vermifera]|nr:hypothetical protein CPB86DRAFT_593431 [Serendipita vermifera]
MSEQPPLLLRTPTMESEAPPPYTRQLNATTGEQTLDQGFGSSRNHACGSGRPSTSAEQSNPKPTHNPTPGHPLLRYGRVLIYPQGFLCRECFNKGYQPAPEFADTFYTSAYAPGDPGHPCLTCWGKYGQEYTDDLEQMDWSDETTVNRQRPIYTVDHAVRGSQYYHLKGSSSYTLGYEPANDGKPTSTPFPGHPLLRYNQVLVYPMGFKCDKCEFVSVSARGLNKFVKVSTVGSSHSTPYLISSLARIHQEILLIRARPVGSSTEHNIQKI